ncbi:6053_t:CDS:2, partial [Ambispora leptoticha]
TLLEEMKSQKIYEDFPEVRGLRETIKNCEQEIRRLQSPDYIENSTRELLKVFDGQDRITDVSKGQVGTGKRADFLQEVLTETEPKKRDMVFHHADYGFIVATCEGDKIIRRLKTEIGDRKVSGFVERAIAKELGEYDNKLEKGQKEFQQKLIADYKRYAGRTYDKEDKMREEAGIEEN